MVVELLVGQQMELLQVVHNRFGVEAYQDVQMQVACVVDMMDEVGSSDAAASCDVPLLTLEAQYVVEVEVPYSARAFALMMAVAG